MSTLSPDDVPTPACDELPEFALRLRQAREAQGLTIAEVAARLRLRRPVIEAIERADLETLGAAVFVRGYIAGYAQLLGLPAELADAAVPKPEPVPDQAPLLHSSQRMSHSRYLLDRYARRFVYVALTAAIVVPVVLLAMRDDLPAPAALLQPGEQLALGDETLGIDRIELSPETRLDTPPATAAALHFEQPVLASLAPIYTPRAQPPLMAAAPEQAETGVEPVPVSIPEQGLVLQMRGDSWVEIIGSNGQRLEHALLKQGTQRQYDLAQVARVLLGNGKAVQLYMNGKEVDLTPYRKANVVRFAVSSDGSLSPSGG